MTAGRKPKPTALKILHGTDRPCRVKSDEPKPKSDKIKMPTGMSVEARKCWRLVSKQLTEAQILTNIDTHALRLYCEAFARYHEANKELEAKGTVILSPNGYPVQSPYLAIANKAFTQMMKLLSEFGMTPASRTKISATEVPQAGTTTSQEDEILNRYLKR